VKIGVVGAGLMGTEIALVFALAGHEVVLCDREPAARDRAKARLVRVLDTRWVRKLDPPGTAPSVLSRIEASVGLSDLAACGLVTEAVFEALDIKSEVLKGLDQTCAPECLFTSNTSTLPISTLSAVLSPARRPLFLGTHYFSPVSRMALVEVIPAFETAERTVQTVLDLMRGIGKSSVVVKDVAGFAVNRMLHALLIEAVKLVEEGIASPADLDTACMLGLGHPIGPFALMDLVTSSLTLQVQEILHDSYGERFRPPALLKQRVAAGLSGGKGKPGWLGPGLEIN
jgi:3-hydroxybutyryl-CoA dehydrogenase